MTEWRWVELTVVIAVHDAQLAEHGGRDGLRDQDLLESALGRPVNLATYGAPDAADLAAAYAHGLVRNHGFADGNKRTAWIIARLFLADNGYTLSVNKFDAVATMQALVGGQIDEAGMADWLRSTCGLQMNRDRNLTSSTPEPNNT